MRISVIGYKGVVGNATYELLRRLGYQVTGSDNNESIPPANLYIICVPEDNVESVVKKLAEKGMVQYLVIIRSSVTPGTCRSLADAYNIHICHLPEFLCQATAIYDEFNPARIIIGECCIEHGNIIEELLKPLCRPIIHTDAITSELVKLASNAYLTCLISYWNSIESIAKKIGVSGHKVGIMASLDPRISSYGSRMHNKYGGSCLPKDLRHLIEFSQKVGYEPIMLQAIEQVNEQVEEI